MDLKCMRKNEVFDEKHALNLKNVDNILYHITADGGHRLLWTLRDQGLIVQTFEDIVRGDGTK